RSAIFAITTLTRSDFVSQYLLPGLLKNPDMDPYPLFVRLDQRSRQIGQEKYLAPFIMLFWDFDVQAEPEVRAALDAGEITYIPVSRIIPDLLTNAPAYHIAPTDLHPTEAANRLIAAYLARRFLDGTIGQ